MNHARLVGFILMLAHVSFGAEDLEKGKDFMDKQSKALIASVKSPMCPNTLQDVFKRADKALPESPTQSVVDQANNMDRFFAALTDLSMGKRRKVRIGFYGDSNHTRDYASGALRSYLGKVFGFGGHGYVAAGQPWSWYQHTEIKVKNKKGKWNVKAASIPRYKSPLYGHAGIMGIGQSKGGYTEFSSTTKGDASNQEFSRFQVFYMCQPGSGAFAVNVDGRELATIETSCPKRALQTKTFEVKPGRHTVKLEVRKPQTIVFGTVFENEESGIVVDGLGVGALNLKFMDRMNEDLFTAGLKSRNYDLVILHTGTNMWAPKMHPKWAKNVFQKFRQALGPDVSILVLSPPDFAEKKKGKPMRAHPRMAACTKEKKVIAAQNNVAFYDFFAEMGGLGSVFEWRKKKLVSGDMVHYNQPFHDLMVAKYSRAIMTQMDGYLKRKGMSCMAAIKDEAAKGTKVKF